MKVFECTFNFMTYYHCHIYFNQNSKSQVLSGLENLMNQNFKSLRLMQIVDRPIGPHPMPMIELHFIDTDKSNIIEYLKNKPEFSSILIHEVTDSDKKDHSTGATWVGEKLEINFSVFRT